jgi:hypothetical protein
MPQRYFWCAVLILALIVGVAPPARAVDPEGVLIIVAATVTAAAIAVVATVASVEHKRKKIVITGCVIAGEKGRTVTDEEDKRIYILSGDTTGIQPADRMKLEGKRVNPKGPDKTRVWETKRVIKDFDICQRHS